ncbi:PGC-1 and ERR-induced regulator in muscle protein 1 isoform X2 [Paroedura picta]|uniref:PGC-1 and ERR-induced regulator in muscle protein 1 isoform X2 n=1 Tax=Paroedura picta TaxID=143630 RepID=UPI004055A1C0
MENFEYSIQLNDRDWAEFYLASEECSLVQAALATAEEPLPSDLEDGEVESRSIRVRVGPARPPSSGSCPPGVAPRRLPLAEEVLSGSEDETDLGSVGRFLCDNSRRGAPWTWSSASQGSPSSHVTLAPLGGHLELAGEREASFAAEGRELEMEDRLTDPDHPLPEVDVAVQKAELPGQISGLEKPACSVPMNVDASKGANGQAGEHRSRPLGLASQQHARDVISQTASVDSPFPLSVGNNVVCGNPESEDLHAHLPSYLPGQSEGAEHQETGTEHFKVSLKAPVPSYQEKPSLFQGPTSTWAPSDPLSASHKEGVWESRRNEAEKAAGLEGEGQTDQSKDLVGCGLKGEGQVDQEISSASCRVSLQKVAREPEASQHLQATVVKDSRCSGPLDRPREAAGPQKDGVEETCHPLSLTGLFEGESPRTAQGNQRSVFVEENIPYCLALEDSLEVPLAMMSWPQDYDGVIGGDTQEQVGKMQDRVAEKAFASDIGQDLPEMYGPEMYEYFFTDTEGTGVGESSRKKETGPEMPSSPHLPPAPSTDFQDSDSNTAGDATHISVPEVYEHFFNNEAQGRKSWKPIFLSMPASEARKVVRALKSLLSKPAHLLRGRPTRPGTPLRRGSHGKLVVFSPQLLEESQLRPEDLRVAVMSPERPLQLALTHRDMCLVFVAFASWAVKTSNLQAPDAWKIGPDIQRQPSWKQAKHKEDLSCVFSILRVVPAGHRTQDQA